MTSPPALRPGHYYHIYNRGNNRENIFIVERNYPYFLTLYAKHVEPIVDTYAYCLLRNHFHILVRIKTEEEQGGYPQQTPRVSETRRVSPPFKPRKPGQQFSNLFNAYAKAINKAHKRSGSLFSNPFGRVMVTSDAHFTHLVTYIHQNPQKHGLVDNFRTWRYSSYRAFLSTKPTRLKRDDVLEWFGGVGSFEMAHHQEIDERLIAPFVPEGFA